MSARGLAARTSASSGRLPQGSNLFGFSLCRFRHSRRRDTGNERIGCWHLPRLRLRRRAPPVPRFDSSFPALPCIAPNRRRAHSGNSISIGDVMQQRSPRSQALVGSVVESLQHRKGAHGPSSRKRCTADTQRPSYNQAKLWAINRTHGNHDNHARRHIPRGVS